MAGNSSSARLLSLAAEWRFTKLALIRKIGEARRNRIGFTFPKILSRNFQRRTGKEMKTKKISGHIIRSGAWAVFLSVAFIAAISAADSPNRWQRSASATGGYDRTGKTSSQPRAFSFVERVLFQRAIEDVYWRHRIWPKENPDRKPALDAVMSQVQLENKVAGYLRDSLMLQEHWQKPITAEQLQAEMDRMARDTKQPEVLRELFEALGNDPAVIAECLARPILAERLIADLSAQDQTRHVESPQSGALRTMSVATTLGQVVYSLPKIDAAGDAPCTDQWGPMSTTNAPSGRLEHAAVWTGTEMIVWGGLTGTISFENETNTGGRYNPSTNTWTATSITNAPTARSSHTAVWTGSEMIVWGGSSGLNTNTGGRYCAQPPPPPLTIIQPNGGEVWAAGSVQQIKWDGNLKHSDHLIIQYSRDGGAS
jgi:hypothetical protein